MCVCVCECVSSEKNKWNEILQNEWTGVFRNVHIIVSEESKRCKNLWETNIFENSSYLIGFVELLYIPVCYHISC